MQTIRLTHSGVSITDAADPGSSTIRADSHNTGISLDHTSSSDYGRRYRAQRVVVSERDGIAHLIVLLRRYIDACTPDGVLQLGDAVALWQDDDGLNRYIIVFVAQEHLTGKLPPIWGSEPRIDLAEKCTDYGVVIPDGMRAVLFARQQHGSLELIFDADTRSLVPFDAVLALLDTVKEGYDTLQSLPSTLRRLSS